MKGRGLAVVVSLLLAVGATVAVFMYVQGVRQESRRVTNTVDVVVSRELIREGARMDELIARNAFTTKAFPQDAVVPGAITDLDQLRGQVASASILAGEQMTTQRLEGGSSRANEFFEIPPGMKAVTVSLGASQAVGGAVQKNDHVTIYATFTDIKLLPSIEEQLGTATTEGNRRSVDIGDFTMTVVPDVQVLRVLGGSTSASDQASSEMQLTLALTPEDAQKVVFAREKGSIWLALIPIEEEGTFEGPINVDDLLRGRNA